MFWLVAGLPILFVIGLSMFGVNAQWEEGIVIRLGKVVRSIGPGVYFKLPLIERVMKRDTRTTTLDIPTQEAITKDNISVYVDAVVFLKIVDTKKSFLKVTDLQVAIMKYAQTVLRNVVGEKELDDLLEKREEVAMTIKAMVDKITEEWGVDIEKIELQNIEIPENMKRVMARQAEAEREKRGVIIAAEGELTAATKLKEASLELEKANFGFALRQLQTISDVSQDQSNTIIFAPSESLNSPILSTGTSARVPKAKSSTSTAAQSFGDKSGKK